MSQITLKDIALQLGLSTSTVSRALSGHHAISDATKEVVRLLAAKLDYTPNFLASNLKRRRTNTIGMIVPDLSHHYFSTIIGGVQEQLFKSGYNLVICQSNDDYQREKQLINTLISNQIDGLLISVAKNTLDDSHYRNVVEKGIPLVFFDRICERLQEITSSVTLDDYNGARIGTKMLLAQGCRSIAMISAPLSLNIGKQRRIGYEDALKFEGINISKSLLLESDLTVENSKEISCQLLALKDRPDGILVASGLATIGCLVALREKGFIIGNEIKVAGFLGDLYSGHKEKGLIQIFPPTQLMGAKAANLLLNQIDSADHSITHVKLDLEFRLC